MTGAPPDTKASEPAGATVPDPNPAQTLLGVSGLYRSFGGVQAVADVSFAVPRGSVFGLIGPNGAGKSTVMNMLAGTERTDRGTIMLGGESVNRLPDYQRARKGMVRAFQHPTVFGRMTVLESLLVAFPDLPGQTYRDVFSRPRRRWAASEAQRIEESVSLLDRFEMRRTANEYADNLSGGQKKLLDLLRAVCAQPTLLLLDEPFAGVHLRNVEAVCELLTELRQRGITILMTEHGLDLVDRLCEVVIIMARGSVIYQGSLSEGLREREVVQAYVAG